MIGAAALAAALKERQTLKDRKVAVVLSGQNIDTDWFLEILSQRTPTPRQDG